MKTQELRQIIREEIRKILIKEINLTPEQNEEFKSRVKYLAKTEDDEYAFDEAGNILARIITNNKAEFIEDVEDFGYNAEEVEEYAQDLASSFLSL